MSSDITMMKLLIDEAAKNLESNNYPVAAGLVVDDQLIDTLSNRLIDQSDWFSHAETLLLQKHSTAIRQRTKRYTNNPGTYVLYSTLEPCLMCFGAAVLNRISKVVYACPDPLGGASHISQHDLGDFYQRHWPIVEQGPMLQESYNLIIQYYQRQTEPHWKDIQHTFEQGISEMKRVASDDKQ